MAFIASLARLPFAITFAFMPNPWLALAPTVVATLTQYVFGAPGMLRYSIAALNIALCPLAVLIFWWGLAPYGKAFARARAWR